MSDSQATIYSIGTPHTKPLGTVIGYSIYHGSSDTLYPDWIVPTADEAWELRHEFGARKECKGHDWFGCIVYSSYGGGSWWPTGYCRHCKTIQITAPWEELPLGWPCDGDPFHWKQQAEFWKGKAETLINDVRELERHVH